MLSRKMTNRVRPAVERLEGRDTPSVLVTPAALPAQSIQHCHTGPAHGHGHHGGVITLHVTGDTTDGQKLVGSAPSAPTESVAIVDSTTGQPGTFQAVSPPGRVITQGNGNVLIKLDRCAVKAALVALNADFSKPLQLEVKVSNGSGSDAASEVGLLTIRPSHHRAEGVAHHHHNAGHGQHQNG